MLHYKRLFTFEQYNAPCGIKFLISLLSTASIYEKQYACFAWSSLHWGILRWVIWDIFSSGRQMSLKCLSMTRNQTKCRCKCIKHQPQLTALAHVFEKSININAVTVYHSQMQHNENQLKRKVNYWIKHLAPRAFEMFYTGEFLQVRFPIKMGYLEWILSKTTDKQFTA